MHARTSLTVISLGLACLAVAGCTATPPTAGPVLPTPVDLCAIAAPGGAASEGVVVDGPFGSPATVTLAAPLEVTGTERTVVSEGSGRRVEGTDLISFGMTVVDPFTGEAVQSQGYDGVRALPVPAATLGQYLGCVTVGSRVVVAAPATDTDPATVRVYDVLDAQPAMATGEQQEPAEGMPVVELAESGAPSVTIPAGGPPTDTRVAVLKKGEGDVVEPGDTVLLHYSGVRWSDGSIFDSSWALGAPAVVRTTDVIAGYRKALEGQAAGSQVVVVIPPASAYGDGAINPDDLTGETLVFVIDILSSVPTG